MCNQCIPTQLSTDEFAERLVGFVNGSAMALMISIGHQTGLFDTMGRIGPATSIRLAGEANLNERYVREWLGAMTTGQVVVHDPAAKTYSLPEEHAAVLTRAATPNNMAAMMQWVAELGYIEPRIVECFREGGGVPYEEYRRFHEVMAEESGQTTAAALESAILPAIPGITDRLKEGIEVLDLGCGSGRSLCTMAKAFPSSHFTGYDLTTEAIANANAFAAEMGVKNVSFVRQDVAKMDDAKRFDLICAFDAIHDQARPDTVLDNIHRALKNNGVFLMQDIRASSSVAGNMDHVLGPFVYTISCMHCMSVSLAQGGMGLGAAWGLEKALEMLSDAGFRNVEIKQLEHDILNDYFIARKK